MRNNNKKLSLVERLSDNRGFSLLEIIVVIIIIGVLSLIAAENFSNQVEMNRERETLAEMEALKEALIGDPSLVEDGIRTDFGLIGDIGQLPSNPNWLVTNPGVSGWNGPYMDVDFQDDPDDYLTDAWGQNYVFSGANLTIYSPGMDVTAQLGYTSAQLLNNSVKVIITDRQGYAPKASDLTNISVSLTLRNGTVVNGTVTAGGLCSFSNIPMGIHQLSATHSVLSETIPKRVVVYPGTTAGPFEVVFSQLPE